jgi:NAD(P)-dependent dehydrogenase (short-subunit alcohol dehydrogenase family)
MDGVTAGREFNSRTRLHFPRKFSRKRYSLSRGLLSPRIIVAITFAPGGRFGSWQPWVAMGAAKAAMEVLVRYFAVALASRGITVNTISPGWVEDSVLNSLPEAFQTGLREWQERGWTPMGRLGTPADIGNAVSLICSEEADWITGQLIEVDGGASLVNSHLPLEFQGMPSPKRT